MKPAARVQNLLEALLNSGQAALLAGGGGGAFVSTDGCRQRFVKAPLCF